MRVKYLVCAVIVGAFLVACTEMGGNRVAAKSIESGQHPREFEKKITKTLKCRFLLFLPEGYGKEEKRWPLMLFLHGAGERGSDLEKVKKHGPPKIVEKQKDFPFIVVSPQCPEDDWWTEKTEVLSHLLDSIVDRYDVDTERIYLTGLSMGGYGTWALAAKYPERFAAIVPICGGGKRFLAWRLKQVPIWAFHGAKDRLVPLKESEELVNAIKRQGGNARLTVYPEAGHDSWTKTYNNKEVYDWLLKYRRKTKKK
jgi:predicted peptidase